MRLTYALIFHNQGVPVLPCYAKSKAILKGYGPFKNRAEDREQLHRWLQVEGKNYALCAGGDFVVLDFDCEEVYQDWKGQVGSLADTFTVRTFRGFHVYYRSQDVRSWKAEGVEVLGRGKAVMGPYSVHPEGVIYQPLNQPAIRKINTVSDFPLLSDSRPSMTEPPEKHRELRRRGNQGKDAISQIKQSWPVLNVLEALQPDVMSSLTGSGRWRSGLCPFHDDNRRSFWIDTERNIFGCHACDAHGDAINLVAMSYGVGVRDAIQGIMVTGSVKLRGGKT